MYFLSSCTFAESTTYVIWGRMYSYVFFCESPRLVSRHHLRKNYIRRENTYGYIRIHTNTYDLARKLHTHWKYIRITYECILLHTDTYVYIRMKIQKKWTIFLHTNTYGYIRLHTDIFLRICPFFVSAFHFLRTLMEAQLSIQNPIQKKRHPQKRYTNILFLFLFKSLLAAAAHGGTQTFYFYFYSKCCLRQWPTEVQPKKFLHAARCYPMEFYEVPRSLLGALGSKTFRTSALTTLSTIERYSTYCVDRSVHRKGAPPKEVHKHTISISIQNPAGGSGPQRYTTIPFLFLFKSLLAAAAHRGTQTFYSKSGRIDYSAADGVPALSVQVVLDWKLVEGKNEKGKLALPQTQHTYARTCVCCSYVCAIHFNAKNCT